MSVPVSELLRTLTPEHRREIERQAAEFLAEETARQRARRGRDSAAPPPAPAITTDRTAD